MAKLDCVSDQDLKAYLLGELPERVADSVARHLESCTDCLSRAGLWDDETDAAVRALRWAGKEHSGTFMDADVGCVGGRQTDDVSTRLPGTASSFTPWRSHPEGRRSSSAAMTGPRVSGM